MTHTARAQKRRPRPISWPCTVAATGARGVAYVEWPDGMISVKLTTGTWIEARLDGLTERQTEDGA